MSLDVNTVFSNIHSLIKFLINFFSFIWERFLAIMKHYKRWIEYHRRGAVGRASARSLVGDKRLYDSVVGSILPRCRPPREQFFFQFLLVHNLPIYIYISCSKFQSLIKYFLFIHSRSNTFFFNL